MGFTEKEKPESQTLLVIFLYFMCFPTSERVTGAISDWFHIMNTNILWVSQKYLWSVNQHREKFPPLAARQPPPVKITIKSHAFHTGIINKMQLLPFKETRRQRQTTSQLPIARPLIISNREMFSVPLLATYQHHLPVGAASRSTSASSYNSPQRIVILYIKTHSHIPKKVLSICIFKHLRCPHRSKAQDWANVMHYPQKKAPLLKLI